MRAMVDATAFNEELEIAKGLLPVLGRPIIIHVLEKLKKIGVIDVDLMVRMGEEALVELVGEGKRWGLQVTHRPVEPPVSLADLPRVQERVIVGRVEQLPDLEGLIEQVGTSGWLYGLGGEWTGWAALDLSRSPEGLLLATLPEHIHGNHHAKMGQVLNVETLEALHATNVGAVRDPRLRDLMPPSVHEERPGVWVAGHTRVHPSVKIHAPVYIGEECEIERGVEIGPYAVLGDRCLIGSEARICRTVVMEGTYVGEGTELEEMVACQHHLRALSLTQTVEVPDPTVLGGTGLTSPIKWLRERLRK